jgi:hypothetical protein
MKSPAGGEQLFPSRVKKALARPAACDYNARVKQGCMKYGSPCLFDGSYKPLKKQCGNCVMTSQSLRGDPPKCELKSLVGIVLNPGLQSQVVVSLFGSSPRRAESLDIGF